MAIFEYLETLVVGCHLLSERADLRYGLIVSITCTYVDGSRLGTDDNNVSFCLVIYSRRSGV